MNIQFDASNIFAPAWNGEASAPQKATRSETERAMEELGKARSTFEKASNTMMDEHHKTVAESAKKMTEYYRQKNLKDQAREAAADRHELNGQVRIESLNHRNLIEGRRIEELDKKESL